jgi:hypothetical protein
MKAKQSQSNKKNPCWAGYQMVGTKDKGGKRVPNCVPKKAPNKPKAMRKVK